MTTTETAKLPPIKWEDTRLAHHLSAEVGEFSLAIFPATDKYVREGKLNEFTGSLVYRTRKGLAVETINGSSIDAVKTALRKRAVAIAADPKTSQKVKAKPSAKK